MNKLITLLLLSNLVLAGTLDVMVYNVENLFDTTHDEGKNDWTYMPLEAKAKVKECKKIKSNYRKKECLSTDWTKAKLELKLDQIQAVVLDGEKTRPQILGLVEVENENVVSMLAKKLGYKKFIVSNSPDRRGIDLALLYDETKAFKFVSKNEIPIVAEYFKKKPTRNILEAKFTLNEKPLYIFVNHWPSLGNPDSARIRAASTLKERILSLRKNNQSASFIAMGDFNTIPKLKSKNRLKIHPFKNVLLVDSKMKDLYTVFMSSKSVAKSLKSKVPMGTYYYRRGKVWNHLDRVFISENMVGELGTRVELSSFKIKNPSFALKKVHGQDAPFSYNHQASSKDKAGYSDHFPQAFKIRY